MFYVDDLKLYGTNDNQLTLMVERRNQSFMETFIEVVKLFLLSENDGTHKQW